MRGLTFDIAHLLAGSLVLVSFLQLYQDRLYALLNVFAVHAFVLALSVAWQAFVQGAPHLYVTALIALVFKAIVIPVAVKGLRIANLSGEVAVRKGEAARVAERVLNESIITTNWNRSTPSGVAMEGTHQFRYQIRTTPWLQEPMRALSVQVTFGVQGQNYDVLLSTLVDNSPPQ